MKFILLVEGKTERGAAAEFLKRWLDRRFIQPIGIKPVPFDGYADLIRKMATKAKMYLEGPNRDEIIGVIALLDLYGPTFYPSDKTTAEQRIAWGREYFENRVNLEKFRLFFAVHEFEAWLLSQPEVFPRDIKDALPTSIAQPERVNFHEPPAKLLERVYTQQTRRSYKKTTYGKQLFGKLEPDVAVQKCPNLAELLHELRELCVAAGLPLKPTAPTSAT